MNKEISLKPTVSELEKATKELEMVRDQVSGSEKEELNLKIKSLHEIREELIKTCGKTYPLYIPRK